MSEVTSFRVIVGSIVRTCKLGGWCNGWCYFLLNIVVNGYY